MIELKWRSPVLLCYSTNDLLCKIKAKAGSDTCIGGDYYEENACDWDYYEQNEGGTDGDEGFDGCTVLGPCMDTDPLLGCDYGNDLYCNLVAVAR